MDDPNVGHLRGLTRRITSEGCFPTKGADRGERIKVEYFEEPPVVLEVGGRRSWQAETADQFCNIWHETTEGSDHVTRWVKSSYDGRMVRESDEV